jgi:hypothetical protein
LIIRLRCCEAANRQGTALVYQGDDLVDGGVAVALKPKRGLHGMRPMPRLKQLQRIAENAPLKSLNSTNPNPNSCRLATPYASRSRTNE